MNRTEHPANPALFPGCFRTDRSARHFQQTASRPPVAWWQGSHSPLRRVTLPSRSLSSTCVTIFQEYHLRSQAAVHLVRQREIDDLISRIEHFLTLSNDWDGYGALPLSKHVADDAITFLQFLPSTCSLPITMPTADNEILMTWENHRAKAMISFFGDSLYHLFFRSENKRIYHDDIPLQPGPPSQKILAAISMAG